MSEIYVAQGCTSCGWESLPQRYAQGETITLESAHTCPDEGDN